MNEVRGGAARHLSSRHGTVGFSEALRRAVSVIMRLPVVVVVVVVVDVSQIGVGTHTSPGCRWSSSSSSREQRSRVYSCIQVTVLVRTHSSSPSLPLNRPKPLLLTPPCGNTLSSWMVMLLTCTAPLSIAPAMRKPRARS